MTFEVHLLGRPRVERAGQGPYQFRSRKSWALLAYLLLSERPPTRSQLASLLFAEADDPLRALRWSLSEIRRCLGDDGTLDGDPLVLRLPPDAVVDVDVLTHGAWAAAVDLPGLGADLLDGLTVRGAPAFESWLLSERRRVAAAAEAILHEAALGSLSRDDARRARGYAVRAAAMSPLDENHQALLIRLYRLAGDDDAAQKQYAACVELFDRELGVAPGVAVEAAMRAVRRERVTVTDEASIEAVIEAGSAAVAAGAIDAGVAIAAHRGPASPTAPGPAGCASTPGSMLAEALIHSLRGLDEEGLATLHEADRIALAADDRAVGRAGPGRARLRGLPARPLRPGRAVAHRRPRLRARITRRHREGHDLPGLGGQRPRRLPAAPSTCSRRRRPRSRGRRRDRAWRRTRCPCWAGSACCAATWTSPTSSSTRRSRSPSATTGWRSCRGRRRCAARSLLAAGDPVGAADDPPAGLRPGLPARRPVLGGHVRPRSGAGRRRHRRHRAGVRHPRGRPGAVQPARRPVRLARGPHPRRAVRARPPARAPGHPALDRRRCGGSRPGPGCGS